jgi:predicted  nucleic acid-binding Zn-ribbon protein
VSVLTQRSSSSRDVHQSGEQITEAQPGSLYCVTCGFAISTASIGSLPDCPNCGGGKFRRASIFDSRPTVDAQAIEPDEATAEWLTEARAELERAGRYLAFDEGGGEYAVVRLEPGWTRIGRSHAADVQLDDATVSRRHALIVLTESGELRALDDRSLNGLFVNGKRVEWAPLGDGDELEIGRYRLHVLEA